MPHGPVSSLAASNAKDESPLWWNSLPPAPVSSMTHSLDRGATANHFYRVLLPKDNQVLTLVLGGIRAPRTARNTSEKSEPYGQEALDYSNRRYMQRDVEIELDSTDKSGGFIGALYVNKTENAAINLVREGLATVHSYSADELPWARQLYDAEVSAKSAKVNVSSWFRRIPNDWLHCYCRSGVTTMRRLRRPRLRLLNSRARNPPH